MKGIFSIIASAAIAVDATSCSSNEWTIKGSIEGGEGHLLSLEAASASGSYCLDTLTLKSDNFNFSHPAPAYPDIYRLSIEGKSVYFAVDSIETVKLTSSLDKFGSEYAIEGNDASALIAEVDKKVASVAVAKGEQAVATDEALKRELAQMIVANPSGLAAYYIINKKVGGTAIFSPLVKSDLRVIGAVANAYSEKRPNDPRTDYLKALYLSNRAAQSNIVNSDTLTVAQTHIFEISLPDVNGKNVSLVETASKGNVVLLNFTAMTADESPAFNVELNKIYSEYHSRGFEIYQVSVDDNEYAWRKAAKNLPWVSVYAGLNNSKCLVEYNVNVIPALYVIDRNGEIAERITDISKIKATVAKYL